MSLLKKIFKGNILYYPGCLSKFVAKDLVENYRQILKRSGVDFIELADLEVCCGSPVLAAGYPEEFKKLAEKNLKVFKEHSISKIITNCPACFKIFSVDYPQIFGKKWDLEIEYIIQTIARSIKEGKLKIKKESVKKIVTYHDPCHLGRLMGIYDEPREVLNELGINLKEMDRAKSYALCCGGGGGMKSNYPEVANKIAKERLGLASEIQAECLVTSCPLCYLQLKENSNEIEIKEISQFIND